MPIPDTPQTREEMYLNAAATGNTSGIPAQPYTRKEMYLEAIANNGGGGGSGGLPPYTSADLGKVLKIGNNGVHVDTYPTIDEQTVTLNWSHKGKIAVDYSRWSEGKRVHLTVNGETQECYLYKDGGLTASATFSVLGDRYVTVVKKSDPTADNVFANDGTYTISATIDEETPIASPVWGAAGGGGGVLVCNLSESGALDHTWQEIADSGFAVVNAGRIIGFVAGIIGDEGSNYYEVAFVAPRINDDMTVEWMAVVTTTDSPNGYPVPYDPGSGDDSGNQS